jgi:undecaprenyl-diphosphatase
MTRTVLAPLVTSYNPTGPDTHGVRVLWPQGANTSLYLDVNRLSRQTAWAHGFMQTYALWLGPVLLALVFVAVYAIAWWRGAVRAAALLVLGGAGTVVALGFNLLIAHAAREVRPYVAHPHVLVLVPKANDYAFPSDHSIVAGGLTLSVLLVLGGELWSRRQHMAHALAGAAQRRRTLPRAVPALVGANVVFGLLLCFARVYVGAHYPGDVVAGYLLSSAVVLAFTLLRPLAYSVVDAVEPTVLGAVLRRPARGSTGGRAAPEPAAHSAPSVPSRP